MYSVCACLRLQAISPAKPDLFDEAFKYVRTHMQRSRPIVNLSTEDLECQRLGAYRYQ